MGALPADRGARSDLADQRVRWDHRPLRRRLRVLGSSSQPASQSPSTAPAASENTRPESTLEDTQAPKTTLTTTPEDVSGVHLPKHLVYRRFNCDAKCFVNGLAICSVERLSGGPCECYRQCFFRVPFTLALC